MDPMIEDDFCDLEYGIVLLVVAGKMDAATAARAEELLQQLRTLLDSTESDATPPNS